MQKLGSARSTEILDVAIEVMREYGVTGLTMKRVSDRVGFSEAAAYKYYSNKQALREAITHRISGTFSTIADEEAARKDIPPRERIERIIERSLAYMIELDGVPITLLAEIIGSGDKVRTATVRDDVSRFMDRVSGLLGEFSPGENAIPVQRVSLAVVNIITGFILWRKILDDKELIESVERDMPEKLTTMLLEAAKLER